MPVESGSTTILNTPQNIYQTSPRVCSTYSSQQDTVHLIHQWLQTNRIKSCWWIFFPAQHLLNSLLEDLGLLFPFCKYWANIHFPLHSIYYCSLWAPLAGPREVLLSPRCHFHVSFGVMGGGSVLQKVWGHPAQLYSLLADSSVCFFQTTKQLSWSWTVFYHGKSPLSALVRPQLDYYGSLSTWMTWTCLNKSRAGPCWWLEERSPSPVNTGWESWGC